MFGFGRKEQPGRGASRIPTPAAVRQASISNGKQPFAASDHNNKNEDRESSPSTHRSEASDTSTKPDSNEAPQVARPRLIKTRPSQGLRPTKVLEDIAVPPQTPPSSESRPSTAGSTRPLYSPGLEVTVPDAARQTTTSPVSTPLSDEESDDNSKRKGEMRPPRSHPLSPDTGKQSVVVAVRIRPLHPKEQAHGRSMLRAQGKQVLASGGEGANSEGVYRLKPVETNAGAAHEFSFDFVQDDDQLLHAGNTSGECQSNIFNAVVHDYVKDALEGYNVTLFAYGQTGSGKTFTMMGDEKAGAPGMVPQLASRLFEDLASRDGSEPPCRVDVTYMEIYQEQVFDLLARSTLPRTVMGASRVMAGQGQDASESAVSQEGAVGETTGDTDTSTSDAGGSIAGERPTSGRSRLMAQSALTRAASPSLMRKPISKDALIGDRKKLANGSVGSETRGVSPGPTTPTLIKPGDGLRIREHPKTGPYVEGLTSVAVTSWKDLAAALAAGAEERTIASTNMNDLSSRSHCIFTITLRQQVPSAHEGMGSELVERVSRINLVDLAGSERVSRTGARGQRLSESIHINKSLSTLNDVITQLSRGSDFVGYRNSALTWLLKESLGGNSKTIMIASISPAAADIRESVSTLRYANRARRIRNRPVVNEDPREVLIRSLREELSSLRGLFQSLSMQRAFHVPRSEFGVPSQVGLSDLSATNSPDAKSPTYSNMSQSEVFTHGEDDTESIISSFVEDGTGMTEDFSPGSPVFSSGISDMSAINMNYFSFSVEKSTPFLLQLYRGDRDGPPRMPDSPGVDDRIISYQGCGWMVHFLRVGVTRVGSGPACEVMLDSLLSEHAEVLFIPPRRRSRRTPSVILCPLQNAGVTVNGQLIQRPVDLYSGDRIVYSSKLHMHKHSPPVMYFFDPSCDTPGGAAFMHERPKPSQQAGDFFAMDSQLARWTAAFRQELDSQGCIRSEIATSFLQEMETTLAAQRSRSLPSSPRLRSPRISDNARRSLIGSQSLKASTSDSATTANSHRLYAPRSNATQVFCDVCYTPRAADRSGPADASEHGGKDCAAGSCVGCGLSFERSNSRSNSMGGIDTLQREDIVLGTKGRLVA